MPPFIRICANCGTLNPVSNARCKACGDSLSTSKKVDAETLPEHVRDRGKMLPGDLAPVDAPPKSPVKDHHARKDHRAGSHDPPRDRPSGSATPPSTGLTVSYQPQIIRKFAERLYDKAAMIVVVYTTLGVVAGLALGSGVQMLRIGGGGVIALSLAVFGGAVGYLFGTEKAFWLKLQAQTALCQVAIEENTRRAAQVLLEPEHSRRPAAEEPLSR